MDIQTYLERLNYHGPVEPTAETLRQLQVAHLLAVPFENLSIHNREPIVLSDEALFEKVVKRRRGGFCYELNGLFAALLRSLGFDVAMLSAQVANGEGGFGPDFDHMALMVTIDDERWLADVGFGDSFIEPLLLDERKAQIQGNRRYRIVAHDEFCVVQSREGDQAEDWKPEYRFTLNHYQYSDYSEMCEYHQTSPESHFTKARICSRLTPNGRMTISDKRLITTEAGDRREHLVESQEEYATVLRQDFGIVM